MKRNKLAKKVLAGIMSAAILAAMPVYAENTEGTGSTGNTENTESTANTGSTENNDHITVSYSQDTTYTLSIPSSITLSSTDSKTATNIGVSAVNTTPTEKVQVKIKSGITTNNQVELTRDGDSTTKVVSDVTDGLNKKVSIGTVIAEFQDTSIDPITTSTGVLNFSAVKDSSDAQNTIKAGKYEGTIVFEADVVTRS